MHIILICRYETGGVGLNAARIDGVQVPERHYEIANHQVVLEGDDAIVHHDVEELLAMGDLYRLPTPQEQEAMAEEARKRAEALESGSSTTPPVDSKPASKKVSG